MTKRHRNAPRNPFDPLDGDVDATLDLHGDRADEARTRVTRFLAVTQRRQPGALVHIITGKGRRSPQGPVLKGAIRTLLRSGTLKEVVAWGPDLDGGGYLIRLR
jgi:DNA-nicking Smr family endonuclease